MIRQCCACHAIEILDEWVEYPEAIEGASHGYCPPCLAKLSAEVDALEARSALREREPGHEDYETPMGEDVDG